MSFEDNEAVIKMTIRSRSPTMRHVSRTHRVALDWLFDKITLEPKIQIRYIDTKHQLADNLIKRNFTRDEWNNLLHLFNTIHCSSTCYTNNFSLISCSTVAKRIQEHKEEERVVSKSRPAAMNTSSFVATSSSTASNPIASQCPGMPMASVKPDRKIRINQNSFDAASTSQMRPVATRSTFEDSNNPEAEIWYYEGKQVTVEPVAQNNQALAHLLAHGANSSVDQGKSKRYRSDMETLPPNIATHIP